MKKFLSIALSLAMVFSLSATAFAAEQEESSTPAVSEVYDIPVEVMNTLDADILSKLYAGVENAESITSNDTYIKVTPYENGESVISEATYEEYIASTTLRNTDENDWMRIHTTIIDKGSYAQVSAAYTWLTRANFRLTDVIGLSITQGTFIDNSADGFYTNTTSVGSKTYDFSDTPSRFDYQGHGIVRKVTLEKPNEIPKSDFMFMSANIHKEATSEGLNGTYGHQRASISIAPSFTIDRTGWLSAVGINIGMTYDQFSGYTDIAW